MGQRIVRVNELLKREISQQLHTLFRQEATYITITKVETSPDLRAARVFFSVLGDAKNKKECTQFLIKMSGLLRKEVYRYVTLKYSPKFEFVYDDSIEKEVTLMNEIDKLSDEDNHDASS
ncbi:MAG: ribosome-binding factor A [Verrucomicrobia bacterium CG_4_10_14_3_um_filter_43_23]|nr:MAG: ribosome-binding factor A [Verrucomicrobia bacterium CG1_02_43_26]PIP59914.1 MAG: ribosome-binding factor A [Verrucomicrobia bacterium CG22_combo_CG10-13_8_21_14_all_43_17]PIX58254.1 MAG: ribosome-binding factor A [Verrucomicrobia bacterium CG_4_10_14_3_um_filter_43_23]PIY62440.1 MAG: ribosome-binding factor A [Verrucomicrobia bacterium CG_4_10_14_0_8_um_filter_43_34]PJA44446.1 MAG: ribosome-binding factor A [Verrucomicrobia bacterium CG_4_9_14_3_um_filter_43_20]